MSVTNFQSHIKKRRPSARAIFRYLGKFVWKGKNTPTIQNRFKIGRSKLNNQDSINKKELQDKLCENCNVSEDTEHYFLNCPRYESQRRTRMFLEIDSILNDKNLSKKILDNNLQCLSENKNLSKSAREQILCAIELFLREKKD